MQVARLLAIGTELALGQSVDTNSAWLAKRLAERGLRSQGHECVADDLDAIVDAFVRAASKADVVVATGGLGPTDDDLTRAAIARAAGVRLVEREEALRDVLAFFEARRRAMPERNRVQALMPEGARVLLNSCGTAPGIHIRIGRAEVFSLPGVPLEMRTMYETGVAPALPPVGGAVLRSRSVHTCGRPEAEVNDLLGELMKRGRNPEVGTSAALGEITVKINVEAASAAEADRLIAETARVVGERLGDAVYGYDGESLAFSLGSLLKQRRETLAVAESCTGGLLGELLTDVAGSSAYFLGGAISYHNDAKRELLGVDGVLLEKHGAVSAPVAIAMAEGAARRLRADHALSITGIAGPGGGTAEKPVGLVYVGVAGKTGVEAREFFLGADQPRDFIRQRAARGAINWLRTRLLRGR